MASKAGRQPYGKRGDKQQRRREKRTIREICAAAANGRATWYIRDWLNSPHGSYEIRAVPGPTGGKWSSTTVDRIIEANQRIVKRMVKVKELKRPKEPIFGTTDLDPKPPLTVEIMRFDDDDDGPWFETEVIENEAEYEALKRAAEAGREAAEQEARRRRMTPKDWGRAADFGWMQLYVQGDYQQLGLAGKDTWAREVMPVVMELTYRTGKPVLDLLDAIPEGVHPQKGLIRRMVFGLMRQLAMERETVEALRARIKAMEDAPKAQAEFEAWKASKMVDPGD